MTTDSVDLEAIRRRLEAATPGPWYAHNPDDAYAMNVYCVTTSPEEPDTQMGDPEEYCKEIVAMTLFQAPRVVCHDADRWEQDAAFIAHARTDVALLLDEVNRLREGADELRAQNARLLAACRTVKDALGPAPPGCCEGCAEEIWQALHAVGEVLG